MSGRKFGVFSSVVICLVFLLALMLGALDILAEGPEGDVLKIELGRLSEVKDPGVPTGLVFRGRFKFEDNWLLHLYGENGVDNLAIRFMIEGRPLPGETKMALTNSWLVFEYRLELAKLRDFFRDDISKLLDFLKQVKEGQAKLEIIDLATKAVVFP